MYMRFGNILNELLMEYHNGNPFVNNGDLTLSVADDSTDYYVMTVSSEKFKRILGTYTITTSQKETENGYYVEIDAMVEHKFEKVPNKEVMMMALGLYPNAILNYMFHVKYAGDEVPLPKRIIIQPKSPIEKRVFAGNDFDQHLYRELYANLGRNSENPMSGYYNRHINGGGIMYYRY